MARARAAHASSHHCDGQAYLVEQSGHVRDVAVREVEKRAEAQQAAFSRALSAAAVKARRDSYLAAEGGFAAVHLFTAVRLYLTKFSTMTIAEIFGLSFVVMENVAVIAWMVSLLSSHMRESKYFPWAVVYIVMWRSILAYAEVLFLSEFAAGSFRWAASEFSLLSAGRVFTTA